MHHDFGAGDHHAPNIDGHAGEHPHWIEQKRKRHARHQGDDRGKWDRDPQDAYVPAVAHGDTEIVGNQDLSVTSNAKMLEEFLDAVKIEQVDLVGNDSGGGIPQIFAALYWFMSWIIMRLP